MWLSKNSVRNSESGNLQAENATITISTHNQLEVNGSSNSRAFKIYTPYGYSSYAPSGEEALMIPTSFGKACVGTKMDSQDIKEGEIKIVAKSGAYIWLKDDGTVEINGKVYGKSGK